MVYFTRRFVLCLTLCPIVLVFFSPFSIAITSLGEQRELILVLFVRLFDLCLFGFVGFLFLLVSVKGCGVFIVAHSGLLSYLFFFFFTFFSFIIQTHSNLCYESLKWGTIIWYSFFWELAKARNKRWQHYHWKRYVTSKNRPGWPSWGWCSYIC